MMPAKPQCQKSELKLTHSIVEISQDGKHLSLFRGFLKISEGEQEIARIPLDSISAVLVNCYQANLSQNIMLACADEGIPIILCGTNHQPKATLLPVVSHHKQAGNLQAQLSSSKPLAKQLWKQLIQAKITGQHQVLEKTATTKGERLLDMASKVKSGDPDNLEAQAARYYWQLLMGVEFTRNQDAEGANALLNYGYTILHATVARAVVACGLHPSLGVHHQNRLNAFCLVSDLMEPYRPIVDYSVLGLVQAGKIEITRETKQELVNLMQAEVRIAGEYSSVSNAILKTTQSLVKSFNDDEADLLLPKSVIPK